jgi:hypothetical protein
MTTRGTIKRLFGMMGLEIPRSPRVFSPQGVGDCKASRGTLEVVSFAWARANESLDYIEHEVCTRWDLVASIGMVAL